MNVLTDMCLVCCEFTVIIPLMSCPVVWWCGGVVVMVVVMVWWCGDGSGGGGGGDERHILTRIQYAICVFYFLGFFVSCEFFSLFCK